METGVSAMFVRLLTERGAKYINLQYVQTIEPLYYEPEGSIYADGWVLRFGPEGELDFNSMKITARQFQQLVEFLPIANRAYKTPPEINMGVSDESKKGA